MEDPLVIPPEISLSHSPETSSDDEGPECKKRKLEDNTNEDSTQAGEVINEAYSPSIHENENDEKSSQSPTLLETAEVPPASPVQVVSIDFDSVIGDDDEEIQPETTGTDNLNKTIDLSEEEEDDKVESDSESSSSSSDDEVELVKKKQKQVKVKSKKKSRRKAANQRRNIKEVLGQEKLDKRTVAAQKEEWERRERIAAKQKSLLGMSRIPISMEQIMERFSHSSSVVSMTPISETEKPKTSSTEHEVFTLSSDDEEDVIPCFETKGVLQHEPPPLVPLCNSYDSFMSDSRSRYSGGTMIVNHHSDRSDVTFGDELEELVRSNNKLEEEEDDDDDCVVLSPPPPDVLDDEKDEDAFNVPDEFGRVLVNVGHPPEEQDIFLAPQIARAVKPHQIGGIRFMYDNIVESLERYNNSQGFGCILAHSMGLGKTIQAAAFCDIFLNYTSANTVLVIVPINTIQNWLNEFNHWLPSSKSVSQPTTDSSTSKKRGRKNKVEQEIGNELPEDELPSISPEASSSSGDEDSKHAKPADIRPRSFEIFVLNETVKNLTGRAKIISDWTERRGVLLIGYEMYRMLALKRIRKTKKKATTLFPDLLEQNSAQEEDTLEKIYNCLVKPGPDLVICDEGHRIKNSGASISQALKAIKTKRRIVLTGYPLQNNLMEYHCMCDFIRPNYLGTKAEFSNMFERPIINGQCVDSTVSDKRLMQFRSHVLHSLLEGFVQRRSHLVLQRALPRKEEWVFLVKMTPIQTLLYTEFINFVRHQAEIGYSTPNPIKAFAICCKIWNHPDVLYNVIAKKGNKEQAVLEDLEDLAEEVENLRKKGGNKKRANRNNTNTESEFPIPEEEDTLPDFGKWSESGNNSNQSAWSFSKEASTTRLGKDDSIVNLEWSLSVFKNYVPNLLENGTKFELLFIVIQETVNVGDKLLVFSQSLLTLNLMELFLGMKFQWSKGKQYFRLDGSTTGLERERLIKQFNKDPTVHVFLVSTRAGSLGINLIGANRVVVFDASWNPCHDCQAVCRIYRYGQQKRCQIYRFVTDCTLEKKIYDRQITKRGMANRVVDEMNPDSHFSTKDLSGSLLLDFDDLLKLQSVKINHDLSRFDDPVIHQLLLLGGDKITKVPFEHESLLIDRKEKKLSKAERRLALRNYEMEKKAILNQGLSSSTSSRNSYNPFPHMGAPQDFSHLSSRPPVAIAPAPPGWNPGKNGEGDFQRFPPRHSQNSNYGYGSGGYGFQQPYFPSPAELSERINGLPLPVQELRKKGISVQGIVLKKDSFLADPENGPDIFLMAGQKVYLFRSNKGTYLRLGNGRFIKIRNRTKGTAQNILDTVPPSQDLTKDQVYIVINSILRPRLSSAPASNTMTQPQFNSSPGRYIPPSLAGNYGYDFPPISPPRRRQPMSVPLPPSYNSYMNYQQQNQRNLQITNQRSSSGGDVTIWKKDATPSSTSSSSSTSTSGSKIQNGVNSDIIPDIEVIKINPEGENQRIEPTQLESELRSQNQFNSFASYFGKEMNESSMYSPPIKNSARSSSHPPHVSSSVRGKNQHLGFDSIPGGSSSMNMNNQHQFRSTQSPLDSLRQLSNYKISDEVVIDYLDSNSSNSDSNPIPDSLYSKLLKSQHALSAAALPPSSYSTNNASSSTHGKSDSATPTLSQLLSRDSPCSNRNNDGSRYKVGSASSSLTRPNNSYQYYTNGGSVSVNEKPAKAIFTPQEQEILDRHRSEV